MANSIGISYEKKLVESCTIRSLEKFEMCI